MYTSTTLNAIQGKNANNYTHDNKTMIHVTIICPYFHCTILCELLLMLFISFHINLPCKNVIIEVIAFPGG